MFAFTSAPPPTILTPINISIWLLPQTTLASFAIAEALKNDPISPTRSTLWRVTPRQRISVLRLLIVVAVISLPVFNAAEVACQAWVQPVDGYFVKLSADYLFTSEQYNARGDLEPIAANDPLFLKETFRDLSITAYAEYGLTDRYTLVTRLPFKISSTQNTQAPLLPGDTPNEVTLTNGGLGDLWLWVRAPFKRTPTAVSMKAGVKMPLGYEDIPDNGGPALGTGKIDAEVSLLVGQSFYPLSAYISGGVGYRLRGGADFDDEVIYNIEGGYTTGPLFMKIRFEGLQNVGPIPDLGTQTPLPGGGTSSSDANARNQDRFTISPVIALNLTRTFGVTAEAYHVIGGKNTIAGTTWVLGVILTPDPSGEE